MVGIQKKITYTDFRYMEIPDGDTSIYELINGQILCKSPLASLHQITISNLVVSLGKYIDVKEIFS